MGVMYLCTKLKMVRWRSIPLKTFRLWNYLMFSNIFQRQSMPIVTALELIFPWPGLPCYNIKTGFPWPDLPCYNTTTGFPWPGLPWLNITTGFPWPGLPCYKIKTGLPWPGLPCPKQLSHYYLAGAAASCCNNWTGYLNCSNIVTK